MVKKLAAEIRANLGPNCNERQEEDFRMRFRQNEQDMFIPDDVVGWKSTTLSDGNDSWVVCRRGDAEFDSRLKRSRSDLQRLCRESRGPRRTWHAAGGDDNKRPIRWISFLTTSDVNKRRIAALGISTESELLHNISICGGLASSTRSF